MTPIRQEPAAAVRSLTARFAFGFALGLATTIAAPAVAIPMDTVVVQGLDKITARVSTIEIPVGSMVEFGALQITARACDKHPPEEPPESAAFLEVVEVKPDEKPVQRFSGWMFASSPALSALEHPVYDLIVLDCVNRAEEPTGDAPADGEAPAEGDAQETNGGTGGAAGESSNSDSSEPSGNSQ